MNYEQIQNIIETLALQNMNLYPEDWNVDLKDVMFFVENIAEEYWESRTEQEIKRDENAEISLQDYKRWISWQWVNWVEDNKDWTKIETVQDLFEWASKDLEDDYDFYRDLVSDKIFHPAFELLHEDDGINFNFNIIEDKEWNSVIEFNSCQVV